MMRCSRGHPWRIVVLHFLHCPLQLLPSKRTFNFESLPVDLSIRLNYKAAYTDTPNPTPMTDHSERRLLLGAILTNCDQGMGHPGRHFSLGSSTGRLMRSRSLPVPRFLRMIVTSSIPPNVVFYAKAKARISLMYSALVQRSQVHELVHTGHVQALPEQTTQGPIDASRPTFNGELVTVHDKACVAEASMARGDARPTYRGVLRGRDYGPS